MKKTNQIVVSNTNEIYLNLLILKNRHQQLGNIHLLGKTIQSINSLPLEFLQIYIRRINELDKIYSHFKIMCVGSLVFNTLPN